MVIEAAACALVVIRGRLLSENALEDAIKNLPGGAETCGAPVDLGAVSGLDYAVADAGVELGEGAIGEVDGLVAGVPLEWCVAVGPVVLGRERQPSAGVLNVMLVDYRVASFLDGGGSAGGLVLFLDLHLLDTKG